MDNTIILISLIDIVMAIPMLIILISREKYIYKFNSTCESARLLGFLISVNGAIRTGKTSFQSGLSHIYQLEIEYLLTEIIENTKKEFKKINFNTVNKYLDTVYQKNKIPDLDATLEGLINVLVEFNFDKTLIFNFLSVKRTRFLLEQYIFAYWVYHYRKNYVQSKTKFYSHITGSFNYGYKIEDQKIFEAFANEKYSIYDFMVELIDELSDELGASKRYEDVKEESGDKDYRRKYGQIHQERNRMITTKQDSRDEIKKFRSLTQSNLWLPKRVEVVGDFKATRSVLKILYMMFEYSYNFIFILVPYLVKLTLNSHKNMTYEEYKEVRYNAVNIKRNVQNRLFYIDAFLGSLGYNKYEVWNYPSEEDVKKRDPTYYDLQYFFIPTKYCFGTYDTHHYRMIQHELLQRTKENSKEINWFINPNYFEVEAEIGGDKDEILF